MDLMEEDRVDKPPTSAAQLVANADVQPFGR